MTDEIVNKSFKAVAVEDLKVADFVAIQLVPNDPERLEVYRWRRHFNLPPAGMVLFNANKGDIVEVFSRLYVNITPSDSAGYTEI